MIEISGAKITLKKTASATIRSIYGVGRVRAKKISDIMLKNPRNKKFKEDLVKISQDPWVQKLFKSFIADNRLKLAIFSDLERKAKIKCYSVIRILQNLPSRGQRTHTNAGTPKRLNPFTRLGVNDEYSQEMISNNKKWELSWNNRAQEFSEFDSSKKKRKFNKGAKEAKAKAKKAKTKIKKVKK